MSGDTKGLLGALFSLIAAIALFALYVANIVKLCGASHIGGLEVVRIAGILFGPLGMAMGLV